MLNYTSLITCVLLICFFNDAVKGQGMFNNNSFFLIRKLFLANKFNNLKSENMYKWW